MDQETSTISTPTSQPTQEMVQKKCKHLPIIVILAVLAVIGVSFGVFGFYQNSISNSELTTLRNQLANNGDDNGSSTSSSDLPSIEETENILENYIGTGSKTGTFLNAFYDTFVSDFDDNHKAFLAYSHIEDDKKDTIVCANEYYEKGACTTKSVSYDLINQKYQSLFGDSASIKKENYAFHDFFYLVYNSATNSYDEYVLQGGGTSPVEALHKVISIKSAPNGFIATVSFMEMNLDVELTSSYSAGTSLGLGIGIKEETINDAIESMAVYEFKFVKNGEKDNFVLSDVTKLGN